MNIEVLSIADLAHEDHDFEDLNFEDIALVEVDFEALDFDDLHFKDTDGVRISWLRKPQLRMSYSRAVAAAVVLASARATLAATPQCCGEVGACPQLTNASTSTGSGSVGGSGCPSAAPAASACSAVLVGSAEISAGEDGAGAPRSGDDDDDQGSRANDDDGASLSLGPRSLCLSLADFHVGGRLSLASCPLHTRPISPHDPVHDASVIPPFPCAPHAHQDR